MKKLTKRLASGLLTALMLVTSLPVDSLAKTLSSTISGYTNDAVNHDSTCRNFVDSKSTDHNLSFDLSGDAEGQSIMTKGTNTTHGTANWYFRDPQGDNNTRSPGEITSNGGITGSGKYLKIYGDSYFQMGLKPYIITDTQNTPSGYKISFDYKSDVSKKNTPNAFFFRCDSGDGITYRNGKDPVLNLHESDSMSGGSHTNDSFIGGTGIALWVSGKHTLTLVIKKVHTGNSMYVDNEFINFYVEEDLTTWNNYCVIDNGRKYHATQGKDPATYYQNEADICFYLNGTLLFRLQCLNYGQLGRAQRTAYLHASGTGGTVEFATGTTDTDYFFRSCVVKDAGGMTIKTVDGSLIRNYSRVAFVCRPDSSNPAAMGIDNLKMVGYRDNGDDIGNAYFIDSADADEYNKISLDGAIYLPITIRDYNNDGMLFEYNDQWDGTLSGIDTVYNKSDVVRGGVSGGKASKAPGFTQQINTLLSGTCSPANSFSSLIALSAGSPTNASWSHVTEESSTNLSIYGTDYYRMTASSGDPQVTFALSGDNRVKSTLVAGYAVRYRTTVSNSYMRVYYQTTDNTNWSTGTAVSGTLISDGKWHNAYITNASKNGKITNLRIDFLDANASNGSKIDIKYVMIVGKHTPQDGNNGTEDLGESFTSTVSTDTDSYYPYYTFTQGFSKSMGYIGGANSSLNCSDYRYALVRYKTTTANQKITVNYYNDNTLSASSGAKLVYSDGKWHDLFVRVGSSSTDSKTFTKINVDFDGNIDIIQITPLKYVRFTGTATYGYVTNDIKGETVCHDESGNKLIYLDRNDVDLGTVDGKKVYYANVKYKTTASELTLVVKTHSSYADKDTKTVKFSSRGDGKWHTAAVPIQAEGKVGQIYVTCDDDKYYLSVSEVVFFHYSTSDSNRLDLCKFYATYYNPKYEYSDQTGNNLAFGLLVYQNPSNSTSVDAYKYYTGFKSGAPTYYFGTNHRTDSTAANGQTSGGLLANVHSYGIGTSYSDKGYLTFKTLDAQYGKILSGLCSQCLTEATLGDDGKPVYKQETVRMLASILAYALRVGMTGNEEDDAYGFYNRVLGEVNDELFGAGNDFASFIRNCIPTCTNSSCMEYDKNSQYYFRDITHYRIGFYTTSLGRRDKLTLEYLKTNPDNANLSCMDFAFYMLDNLYVSGQDESGKITGNGYSMEISEYDSLALIQTKDQNGNSLYTFSSARANTEYDTTNRVIYNTQTVREPYYDTYLGSKYLVSAGYPYYDYMFNPLGTGRNHSKGIPSNNATALGYGDTDSKYLANDGVSSFSDYGNRYSGYNYNFTMEGIAQFVYHEDDNLFFRFMGDDDVYLYVNNKLILDIGAGHSRCDTEVYLNEANKKHSLGLVEGETYTFKFFYMERHGFAGNFSIQTNIRLSDPSMPVDKLGYVGNEELAYGDNVQESDMIEYEFTAKCEEGAKSGELKYFYFDDNDLGFELGYTAADDSKFVCNLGTYGDAKIARSLSDLTLFVTDADGKTVATCTDMSEAGVKAFLKNGITAGQTMHVKGVKHKLSEAQIDAMTFKNLVTISSYYPYGGFYHRLDANSAFVVNVSELFMYLWAGHERTYNFSDLLTDSMRIGDSTYGAMKSGTIGVYISDRNKNAITNTSHKITGTSLTGDYAGSLNLSAAKGTSKVADTGVSTFFFTLIAYVSETDSVEKLGPFGVRVYAYDVSDANYVLDYGLPVTVYADPGSPDEHGTSFIDVDKDTLTLSANTDATYELFGFASSFTYNTTGKLSSTGSKTYTGSGTYGNFAGGQDTDTFTENITYTPNKFIQGIDSVQVAVGVYAKGTSDYSIRTGVQMYKSINFMPASIMYYEENIGSITYKQGMTTGTIGTATKYQSSNQNESYGYDSAYSNETSTSVAVTTETLFKWYNKGQSLDTHTGVGGFDGVGNNYNFSNGSYAKLDTRTGVDYKSPVASFDFKGTGFELISFTNYSSATVRVDVIDKSSGTKVKGKLVKTTFTQGSLNQVPIIDIDNLAYVEYTVNIYVIKPLSDGRGDMFFLDGVRIYNPTTDENIIGNYKKGEAGAKVEELRTDILKNNNTVAVLQQTLGQKLTFTAGQSYVERIDSYRRNGENKWGFAKGDGTYTYENVGPNNEIYLKSQTNALVFRVQPDNGVNAEDILFEIEAKMVNDVELAWRDCIGIDSDGKAYYPNVANGYTYVDSYTSRYYAMDVSKCIKNSDGTYTVIVLFNTPDAIVSLTNVKYNNCTLLPIDLNEMITENGTVAKTAAGQLLSDVITVMDSINEGYEINEDLVINSVTTTAAYEADEDVIVKVSASANAETVYVLDSDGNEVDVKSIKSVTYGENVMFTVNLGVLSEGTYSFTFDVADSDGRTCADTVTKTVTVEE